MEIVYISVVIPTYNRAKLLKEYLDSLVLQIYKPFEVLVCDDGLGYNIRNVIEV